MDEPLYRIGEAARLLELETFVLRFWETEFPQLQPLRTPKGQRKYTQSHLELLKLVKHLLHNQGMTIEGARKILAHSANLTNLTQKADPFAAQDAINATATASQINHNAQITKLTQVNSNIIPSSLPVALSPDLSTSPTAAPPERHGKTQVKLIQGSLVPPGLLQPPNKDRKLLLALRRDLEALRDTLRSLPTEL